VRRTRLAAVVLGGALALGSSPPTGPPASAADCAVPSYRVVADAAPVAALLDQGTTVYVPVAYSHLEHETTPQYLFAEAGSTALGPLEGTALQPAQLLTLIAGFSPVPIPPDVLPVPEVPGAPVLPDPPGRSVSGYPTESIAGDRTAVWGIGSSRARTSADAGLATSDLGPGVGATSRVSTEVDCDTLTVEAEWSIRAIELPGGIRLGQLGQRARIVLRPEGKPAVEVRTTVLDPALDGLDAGALLDRVPDGPLQDLLRGAGQDLDVGGPKVEVTGTRVRITSAPVMVKVLRPDAPQGVEAHVGHLDVVAERLPSPSGAPAIDDVGGGPVAAVDLPPLPGEVRPLPAPVTAADPTVALDPAVVDQMRRAGAVPWAPAAGLVLLALAWWRLALARRDRWPTADFALTHLERAGRRLRATYLRW
jgi:hypothetical protein